MLFTSEAVCQGHPDKVADQIADAILDACLEQDVNSKVACEILITKDAVVIAGEITTTAKIDYPSVARQVLVKIGYNSNDAGFDGKTCPIHVFLHTQSEDIAMGLAENSKKSQGAGDQGMMFGYATDETKEFMPFAFQCVLKITDALKEAREKRLIPYLMPDGKCQITFDYTPDFKPLHLRCIVISVQHTDSISQSQIEEDLKKLVHNHLDTKLIDKHTMYFINPTGRFVIGGPSADTGLTGRKLMVDTYGGFARNGGGSLSGKDPSKVDRSASYMARYIAKNIVAAKICRECEIQVAYVIGIAQPVSLYLKCPRLGKIEHEKLHRAINKTFDLTPKGIIDCLNLKRPIYQKTAFGGHFGRNDPDFTWEKTDKIDELLKNYRG